jgi:hypothetical protein
MPHLLEVNEYELNPIITYRLEGLIEADFTAPIVQLWDFKKWSSNFIHLIETDIQKIREELVQTDNLLDKEIEHYLNNESYSNEFDTYKVDLKFQNLIGKYDHASLCNELIEYKKMKLAYVLKTRSEENDVAKYIHFFGEEYNAMDGFLRWCEVEKYKNDQIFEDNLSNLNQFIEKETSQFVFKDSLIKYKEKNIAFGVQQFDIDSLQPDTTITQTVTPFQKRWFYLSGFNLNSDSVKVPFLAQINPKGDIQWNIEPKLINENLVKNTSIKNLQITYDSVCHVVSRTEQWVNDSLMIPKTFIESYTWEGKQIKQYSYDSDLDPVYFWIDEINELYLIVEKGEEQIDSVTTHHPMYVKLFNLNDSLLWERHLNLKGDLVGVTLTNSNFLFTFNCSELNVGKYFLSNKDSNMAIASIYITREGKLSHINEYKYVKNLVASSCFKLSNNTLNIIGKVDSPDQVMSKLVYLLTNENGNLDFSNLKELTFNLIEL